jgi:hypothetical protein
MSDGDRFPSSIPIPDRLVQVAVQLYVEDAGQPKDVRVIAVADLPKLYAHWAEGRVDAVARAMAGDDENENPPPSSHYEQLARAALGLGDRSS